MKLHQLKTKLASALVRTLSVAVIGLALTLPAAHADAAARAKLTLKDGSVVEGELVREVDGLVWLKVSVNGKEETKMFTSSDYSKFQKIEDSATPAATTPANAPKPETKPESKPDSQPAPAASKPAQSDSQTRTANRVPRAAVLTLGEGGDKDMVGIYVMAKPLRDAIPLLKKDNIDIVVFRVNSGGGALLEIQKLSDVIYDEYRKNFRTVAWIDWAISAAAMTSHCIEEVYMTPEGAYGACTGWFGQLQAVQGRGLEEVLFQMEKISARGNHDPQIMRAMQIMEPLSATVSDRGQVQFYNDTTSGNIVLNPKGRVFTFTSQTAEAVRFSSGTASTLDELAKAMNLQEVEWVGVKKPGFAWPICAAEQMQMDFRDKTYKDEQSLDEYRITLDAAMQMAAQGDDERKAKLAGKAREAMNKIISAINNNPNLALFKFNLYPDRFREEWIEPTEKKIRELLKKEKK
ncbi:MAG: hypothetical protein K2Y21_04155 [Phycisphaerales bacterium]|nr:hypothetical protein [Phycisphaerales bacterium]